MWGMRHCTPITMDSWDFMEELSKKTLLAEIETLISYGRDEPTIHPDLLAFLEISDLLSIRDQLKAKVGILNEKDKVWLEQFRKQ